MSSFLKSSDTQERVFIFVMLFFTLAAFFAFGLFHLGKFETTDEHLWKYDRIGQYWQAVLHQEWEKAYINDKPGVTVALISGIGLLREPHPEENEKVSQSAEEQKLFETYNAAQSEKTNFTFRLPVLIFSTLALVAFFFLLQSAFSSSWIALFGTMFMALNPILIGMAQIINPDSFFWIFGGLATVSYIALQNTGQKKFLLLCGSLTGFALLSKYTGFTLFIFYALFLAAKMIFQDPQSTRTITLWKLVKHLFEIVLIFLISIIIFSFFLPAVFIQPEYLFKGISQFFNAKTLVLLLGGVGIFALISFFLRHSVGLIISWLASKHHFILNIVVTLFLALICVSFINVWTGEQLAPTDVLRDAAYANEPKEFNFKPILDRKDGSWNNSLQLFLMEASPLIFSLSPLVLLILFFTFVQSFRRKVSDHAAAAIFSVLLFTLIYLLSTLNAKVVTNVRYLIILYPLLALLAAVSLGDFLREKSLVREKILGTIAFFILSVVVLFGLRPFYFSYTNFFLPQTFSIHDSWGHGSYEAAQYLNSLENPKDLVIWSNSDTVCRFFQGKCLKSRRIDLQRVTPNFFVISKRGAIKTSNRFLLSNNPQPEKDSDYYFQRLENGFVWELSINNRPDNFIKIIPFEK